MATYVFTGELFKEDDGRWSALIDNLPGCATWGYTRAEAIVALQEAAELTVDDRLAHGESIPGKAGATESDDVVTVSVTVAVAV